MDETSTLLLAILLVSCGPGGGSSGSSDPANPTGGPDGGAPEEPSEPDRKPEAHPGPCAVTVAETGEPRATFLYDDRDRMTGFAGAGGPFVAFTYNGAVWSRTSFYSCRIDGPDAENRRQQLASCIARRDPEKVVDYTSTDGRPTRAIADPTLRTGKITIDFTYEEDFLKREARAFEDPTAPDGSRRQINDLLYTWTRNHIGRAEAGHSGETYRVDDTVLPASPMALCMLVTNSAREFPRGRCLAIDQADAGIAEYSPPDGDPLTFTYDDAGNLETVERADGTVWKATFGCWDQADR